MTDAPTIKKREYPSLDTEVSMDGKTTPAKTKSSNESEFVSGNLQNRDRSEAGVTSSYIGDMVGIPAVFDPMNTDEMILRPSVSISSQTTDVLEETFTTVERSHACSNG